MGAVAWRVVYSIRGKVGLFSCPGLVGLLGVVSRGLIWMGEKKIIAEERFAWVVVVER